MIPSQIFLEIARFDVGIGSWSLVEFCQWQSLPGCSDTMLNRRVPNAANICSTSVPVDDLEKKNGERERE